MGQARKSGAMRRCGAKGWAERENIAELRKDRQKALSWERTSSLLYPSINLVAGAGEADQALFFVYQGPGESLTQSF